MCVSFEASVGVGAALLPAGVYCLRAAARGDRSYLALASIPLFFGIQQFCEGVVWWGLGREKAALTRAGSLGFLFFALGFWPSWMPLVAWLIEPKPARKWAIGVIAIASLGWFLALYFPLATDPDRWLETRVVRHSIQYEFNELPVFQYLSPNWLRLFYLLTITVPFAISSNRKLLVFGALLAASAMISHLLLSSAFVSIWCFFAACLSLYLWYVFYHLAPA